MKTFNQIANNEIDLSVKIGNRVHNITEKVDLEMNLFEGKASLGDFFKRKNIDNFITKAEAGELVAIGGASILIKDVTVWKQLKKDLLAADDEKDIKHFGGSGLIKQALGVTIGNIDKIANGLSTVDGSNPSGEDWEAVIAVAVNKINGHEYNTGAEWDRAQKFWGDWERQALLLGADFIKKLKVDKLEQLGGSTRPRSQEWKDAGAKNETPKTDLIDTTNRHNISLKKAGGSQLLSAGKNETIATVQAAMSMFTESPAGKKVVTALLSDNEGKMIAMQEKGTITAVNALAKQDPKTLSKDQLARIADVAQGQVNADYLTEAMQNMFNGSAEMKKFFCWEAATGTTKFSTSPDAIADIMATFKDTGTLEDTLVLDSPSNAGNKLAAGNDFYVSFKTGGGNSRPYLAVRSSKIKTSKLLKNENHYEDMSFRGIIMEELSKEGLLTEELQHLDEWAILRTISRKVSSAATRLLKAITNRIKSVFTWIATQGKKMWLAVLNFFNLKIKTVTITSGGKFPL